MSNTDNHSTLNGFVISGMYASGAGVRYQPDQGIGEPADILLMV